MPLDDRMRGRPARDSAARPIERFGGQDAQFVVLAGVVITAAVLYDVYRRQTRTGPAE